MSMYTLVWFTYQYYSWIAALLEGEAYVIPNKWPEHFIVPWVISQQIRIESCPCLRISKVEIADITWCNHCKELSSVYIIRSSFPGGGAGEKSYQNLKYFFFTILQCWAICRRTLSPSQIALANWTGSSRWGRRSPRILWRCRLHWQEKLLPCFQTLLSTACSWRLL